MAVVWVFTITAPYHQRRSRQSAPKAPRICRFVRISALVRQRRSITGDATARLANGCQTATSLCTSILWHAKPGGVKQAPKKLSALIQIVARDLHWFKDRRHLCDDTFRRPSRAPLRDSADTRNLCSEGILQNGPTHAVLQSPVARTPTQVPVDRPQGAFSLAERAPGWAAKHEIRSLKNQAESDSTRFRRRSTSDAGCGGSAGRSGATRPARTAAAADRTNGVPEFVARIRRARKLLPRVSPAR